MRSRIMTVALAVAAFAAGCSDDSVTSPAVRLPARPSSIVSDAVHSGGKPHFYFLPPMVGVPAYSGTFDATLSPRVEICAWTGSCSAVIAAYTMSSGTGGELVKLDPDAHYNVNWHSKDFNLDPAKTYRIRVLVGDVLLGFADVDVVSSGSQLRNVNTGEYIPLLDGRTLPIKFRVESGFVANIDVQPIEATISLNDTQQYVATATDLHGQSLSVPVTWSSGDEDVATVDQNGLASAVDDGETTISASAAGVTGTASIKVRAGMFTLGAGYFHTCALDPAGAAYCWGSNQDGQLGVSPVSLYPTPVAVSGGHQFVGLASGYRHTCGLTANGSAWCWGYGGYGALGAGAYTNSTVPIQVAGGHSFVSLSAGYFHTCGLTAAGGGYCWGTGFYGGLGTGDFADRLIPTTVLGAYTFRSLDAGGAHTCGMTTTNDLVCWGYNYQGQLGNGAFHTTGNMGVPTPAVVMPPAGHTFTEASVTAHNTCALIETGSAYCWGYNAAGGVGNGTTSADIATPTAVVGGQTFVELFRGLSYHTCGRVTSGAVYCWGYNGFGQLGTGTISLFGTPSPISGTDQWATISTGIYHTCGVTTAGVGKCWGYNGLGQLGTGNFTTVSLPSPVTGGITFATP